MAINFNANSAWNLKPIPLDSVRGEVNGLLISGEEPVMAFHTVRDQLLFTNKRIISIDVQGITGKRKSYSSMPYSKIQFFSIQTAGFLELIPDSELFFLFPVCIGRLLPKRMPAFAFGADRCPLPQRKLYGVADVQP